MAKLQKKSKFGIIDRINMATYLEFIPERKSDLFSEKIPTWKQFFDNIQHTGNIKIIYRNRVIATRGM